MNVISDIYLKPKKGLFLQVFFCMFVLYYSIGRMVINGLKE